MQWYNYIASFVAGTFICNFVPHFIHGISGKKFPTPFSKPPGVGLSSAGLNVLWSLFNLFFGIVLIIAGRVNTEHITSLIVFFIGFGVFSYLLGITFEKNHAKREKE
ncbi:MAG TPA: hypothetical protein VN721_16235 [Flavipsychrobacter sp.]|nr:hypothetical protein [Flavipsychrobacter sp.]